MRFSIFCFIAVMFSDIPLHAQVLNIDREFAEDSTRKGYDFAGKVFLSSDKQKNNVINVSGNIEFDKYLKNKYVILALLRNNAVFNGNQVIQNEGIAHLRYRDNDHRKYSPELFIQYQWNGAWGMEFRNIFGSNLRVKILEKEKGDIYTAVGAFYEMERWNWNGVKNELIPQNPSKIVRDMWRVNTYLKASRKLTKSIDFSTVSFLQFPVNGNFLQPRWYMEANMYLAVNNWLSFVLHWDHIRDTYRAVPIDNFYYSFSMGVQVNL